MHFVVLSGVRSPYHPRESLPRELHAPVAGGTHRSLWDQIVDGQWSGGTRVLTDTPALMLLQGSTSERGARALSASERGVLEWTLAGERRKVVGARLGVSTAHVSLLLKRASTKLGLTERSFPLPLIGLLQRSVGLAPGLPIGIAFDATGLRVATVGVHRPCVSGEVLTQAEKVVASLFVEGSDRAEIARVRQVSVRTVACQLGAVFSKLRVANRCEMVGAFAMRGWLSGRAREVQAIGHSRGGLDSSATHAGAADAIRHHPLTLRALAHAPSATPVAR